MVETASFQELVSKVRQSLMEGHVAYHSRVVIPARAGIHPPITWIGFADCVAIPFGNPACAGMTTGSFYKHGIPTGR